MRPTLLYYPQRYVGVLRILVPSIILFILITTATTTELQEYLVCREPRSQYCIVWLNDDIQGAMATANTITPKFDTTLGCGKSDLKTIQPHHKFIKVFRIKDDAKTTFYCKAYKVFDLDVNGNLVLREPITGTHRIRKRQAPYSLRGRYRGQTQSQYLAIDRGTGKDDGKAEAHSAADSSRASVSGSSGMGQAQSQTMYDPSCEDCHGRSEIEAESLRRPPDAFHRDTPGGVSKGGIGLPGSGQYTPGVSGTYGAGHNGEPGNIVLGPGQVGRPDGKSNGVFANNQPGTLGTNQMLYTPDKSASYNPNLGGLPGGTEKDRFSPIGGSGFGPYQGAPGGTNYGINNGSPNVPNSGTFIPGNSNVPIQKIFGPNQGQGYSGREPSNPNQGSLPNANDMNFLHGSPSNQGSFGSNQNGLPNTGLQNNIGQSRQPGDVSSGSAPFGSHQQNVAGTPGVGNFANNGGGMPTGIPFVHNQQSGPASRNLGPNFSNHPSGSAVHETKNGPLEAGVPGYGSSHPSLAGTTNTGGLTPNQLGYPGGSGSLSSGQISGPNNVGIYDSNVPGSNGQGSINPQGQLRPYGSIANWPHGAGSFIGPDGTTYYCCTAGPNNNPQIYKTNGGTGTSLQPNIPYGTGSATAPQNLLAPGTPYDASKGTYGSQAPSGTWSTQGLPGGQHFQTPTSYGQGYGPGQEYGQGVAGNQIPSSGQTGAEGLYGPGSTSGRPISVGSVGQYGPGSIGGQPDIQGTGKPYGPGNIEANGLVGQSGPYGSGSTVSQQGPGGTHGQYGPGGSNGQYSPGGTNGQYAPGVISGQYGPGSTGKQYTPGGTNGQYIPGGISGQYGPGGTTGQYGPGGNSGQYGPGGNSGQYGPGDNSGQYGPGSNSGQFAPGGTNGQYGPGGANGQYGPGGANGQYGPGGTSGQYAPGGGSGQYAPRGISGQYNPSGTGKQSGPSATGGQNGPGTSSGQTGFDTPGNQYSTGNTGVQNVPSPGAMNTYGGNLQGPGSIDVQNGHYVPGQNSALYPPQYGNGGAVGQYGNGPYGYDNQANIGQKVDYSGIPQNVIDPNSMGESIDGDDSEAEASVSQATNGTVATASSKGGNEKGRAQTHVNGAYTGSGSFSAQAEITGDNKAANSQVTGDKKGASSNAQGSGRNNKSQANVQLGSETGSVLTGSQSEGFMHSSNTQVQGSVKGGMADAQARGPGSTSSQAQIGFTPYKEGDKSHDMQKSPFTGGGTAAAQSSGRTGSSQSQLRGTFKYGITYNGAAQAGASLNKDTVFPNRLPFDKIDVYDESNKNINVNTEKPADTNLNNLPTTEYLPVPNNLDLPAQTMAPEERPFGNPDEVIPSTDVPFDLQTTTEKAKDVTNDSLPEYSDHVHADHHKTDSQPLTPTHIPPVESRRSFPSTYGTSSGDYEYTTDKDDNPSEDYDVDDGFAPEGTDIAEGEQGEFTSYNEYSRDPEMTHQSLQSPKRRGVDVRQTTGGNTQHIVLGSLSNQDAQITQKNSDHPDEGKVYQPGERVPGTGGYTIPVGFTGSVKSVASKDKTFVVGSKDSPSQAQTVSLTPGSGKIKYIYPSTYTRSVDPKNLRSLYNPKSDDNNRYVSVSKSVTRDLDSENNIRKQYSHTYFTKSSSCGYFSFTCTMVSGAEGRKKVCKPKIPTNPDGTPMRC